MTPAVRFLVRFSLVASLVIIGAAVGGMVGSLTARGGSGFDGLSVVLGGLLVGGFLGVVVAMLLLRRSSDAALGRNAVVALVIAGGLVAWGATRASRGMDQAEATQSPMPVTSPAEPPR